MGRFIPSISFILSLGLYYDDNLAESFNNQERLFQWNATKRIWSNHISMTFPPVQWNLKGVQRSEIEGESGLVPPGPIFLSSTAVSLQAREMVSCVEKVEVENVYSRTKEPVP